MRDRTRVLAVIGRVPVIWLLALVLASFGCQSFVLPTGSGSAYETGVGADDPIVPDSDGTQGVSPFDYEAMVDPDFGAEVQTINGGVPFFTEGELTLEAREQYSSLDSLGRCGVATVLVGPETMQLTPRPDLSIIRPSGWVQARYDFIEQSNGALYNRSHLIARSLGGADEETNLITGTTHLNQELMDRFESLARGQLGVGRHVLWRVTPVFEGDELLARGVLIEGQSIEDKGEGTELCLCVWCPNVQPGVEIDYLTGESHATGEDVGDDMGQPSYVLNTRSRIYHLPDRPCSDSIAKGNRLDSNEDMVTIEAQGYRPCGLCHPDVGFDE